MLRQLSAGLVPPALERAHDEVQLLLFVRRGRPDARMGFAVHEMPCPGHGGLQSAVPAGLGDDVQRRRFVSAKRFERFSFFFSSSFHRNGLVSDINECAQNPAVCSNGACENTIGNYRCICNAGYEVDDTGKSCKDINECDMDDTICNGGQCRNTPGSFQVRL